MNDQCSYYKSSPQFVLYSVSFEELAAECAKVVLSLVVLVRAMSTRLLFVVRSQTQAVDPTKTKSLEGNMRAHVRAREKWSS